MLQLFQIIYIIQNMMLKLYDHRPIAIYQASNKYLSLGLARFPQRLLH